jgi:uncharacterized protein
VVIDADTMPVVEKIISSPQGVVTPKEMELLGSLKNGKFIIDDEIDEIEILKNRKRCGIKDTNRADVIIMPNLDCNFACPYCYEEHDHEKRMDPETAKSVKIWLGSVIDNHKVLLLNWFGGEPLLGYKTVLSITKFAKKRCSSKNVSLLINITTNGYAFTQAMIDQFVNMEIFSYQITVDGPPEVHNKTRILKSGKDSF